MNQLNHVAIIMDGNGRWGLKNKKSRNFGHLKGIKSVETIIKSSLIRKIPYLTLYTCLLYTSPSPRDRQKSRMPSSA